MLSFLSLIQSSLSANPATLVLLKEAAERNGAVCLDGSPGGYYYGKGSGSGVNKWYLHLEGGGWCMNDQDCLGRSNTDLGSSTKYNSQGDFGTGSYFSNLENENSMMFNWNKVLFKYCDGSSFSGDNSTVSVVGGKSLYYRGWRVLQAQVRSVLDLGMTQASDVVVSGCSAGGLAAFLHVDYFRSVIPATARVVGMPDSGFFLDFDAPPKTYGAGMRWVFNQMNCSSGVNQKCIAANRGHPELCIFAQNTVAHISTPIFPLQPAFDSWQTSEDLANDDVDMVNAWGVTTHALIKRFMLSNPQNGVFLDSCHHHCGGWTNLKVSGRRMVDAFQDFYENRTKTFIAGDAYPCDQCCSALNHDVLSMDIYSQVL